MAQDNSLRVIGATRLPVAGRQALDQIAGEPKDAPQVGGFRAVSSTTIPAAPNRGATQRLTDFT